jgi:hypothetical protein
MQREGREVKADYRNSVRISDDSCMLSGFCCPGEGDANASRRIADEPGKAG